MRHDRRRHAALVAVLTIVWLAVVAQNAWVCDDAFISLRTVRHLLEGRGLVYNAGERVQAYTHPAWLLVLTIAHAISGEPFYSTLVASLLVAGAATWLLLRLAWPPALLPVAAAVLGSRAIVEYSTSGLENPLLHAWLAMAAWIHLRRLPSSGTVRSLALVTSAVVLTRPDALLLTAPLLWFAVRQARRRGAATRALIRAVAVGMAPLFAWELFSLIYYGAAVPNTALAKLGTGIGRRELLTQGLAYARVTLRIDPLTMVLVVGGWAAAATDRRNRLRPLALGSFAYALYVIWIGGDFMMGRFWAAPAWVGLLVLARDRRWTPATTAMGTVLVVVVALAGQRAPFLTGPDDVWRPDQPKHRHGVSDERAFYAQGSSLWTAWRGGNPPVHRWRELGRQGPRDGSNVAVFSTMGFYGYYADPDLHILDGFALADPLLARLPAQRQVGWRAGHLSRPLPEGYLSSRRTGENRIDDPAVARLYDAIVVVHRGEILSAKRFVEIARLHLGTYRRSIEFERYRYFGAPHIAIESLADEAVRFRGTGAYVELPAPSHAPIVEIDASAEQTYTVRVMRDGIERSRTECPRDETTVALATFACAIPKDAAEHGYDALHVLPTTRHGRKQVELGAVRLAKR